MNQQHVLLQFMLRSWPFPRGAGWLVKRFFDNLRFHETEALVRTTDGFEMRVLPNEHVGRYLYLTGEFDRSIFEVLHAHALPGDVLLDIGANVGYMSACFLQNVPGSRVVAVDPQPEIIDLLRCNLQPFGKRAQVAPVALSDTNGESDFAIDFVNRGASRLVAPGDGTVRVETWTPERLIQAYGIDRIDIIKMDVEGHEETVLRAMDNAIVQFRPRLILFEDHTDKAAPSGSIGGRLRALGYRIMGVHKKLTRLEFPEIRDRADCVYQDYVAVYEG